MFAELFRVEREYLEGFNQYFKERLICGEKRNPSTKNDRYLNVVEWESGLA